MNALSAPAGGSELARFAARSSEGEHGIPDETISVEESDRERDEYVHLSARKLPERPETFVLQDPSEMDAVGLRAYSGRNQLDVAAKRALVDLRSLEGSLNPVRATSVACDFRKEKMFHAIDPLICP
jgi:hypothetical protein